MPSKSPVKLASCYRGQQVVFCQVTYTVGTRNSASVELIVELAAGPVSHWIGKKSLVYPI